MERFRILSDADLESVTVSETYRLLSEIFGPYCFTVSGTPGDQQILFPTRAHFSLFSIHIHEFLAEAPDVATGTTSPRNLSVLDAGCWLIGKYPAEAEAAGWRTDADNLVAWLNTAVDIRCWSGSIWKHLAFTTTYRQLLTAHANFTKHGLLKVTVELNRLRKLCDARGIGLTQSEIVGAKDEFATHLNGMIQYHATFIAELIGRYFLGFYRFVRARFDKNPTNNLDFIEPPVGTTDDLLRYMYASGILSMSSWTEDRLVAYVPETSRSLKPPYPQHNSNLAQADGGLTSG